jgi:hypothetical protein
VATINYTIRDTDNGVKNYLELDSDNDLCSDVLKLDLQIGQTSWRTVPQLLMLMGCYERHWLYNTKSNYIIAALLISQQPANWKMQIFQ